MADFPMPLPDGWESDGAYPANVDAKGAFLKAGKLSADGSGYDLGASGRQRVLEILNSLADTSGSGGVPPAFFDILGNLSIVGIGPSSEIGPLGSLFFGRNLDGSEGTFQLGGMNLQITSTLESIGRPWQANKQYYGTGGYDVRVVPTTPNGHIYGTSSTGMSGSSEPTWPTTGGSVVDGDLTWNDFGPGTLNIPLYIIGPRSNDGSIYPRVHIAEFWAAYDKAFPAWGLGSNGEEILWVTAAPDDAAIANSSRAQYYDDTVGAPKLWIKERDSAGTLFLKIAAALNSDGTLDMHSKQIIDVLDPTTEQGAVSVNYLEQTGRLAPQKSTTSAVGPAPTLIPAGSSFAVVDEFEIVLNDEIEIAAGATLAVL